MELVGLHVMVELPCLSLYHLGCRTVELAKTRLSGCLGDAQIMWIITDLLNGTIRGIIYVQVNNIIKQAYSSHENHMSCQRSQTVPKTLRRGV